MPGHHPAQTALLVALLALATLGATGCATQTERLKSEAPADRLQANQPPPKTTPAKPQSTPPPELALTNDPVEADMARTAAISQPLPPTSPMKATIWDRIRAKYTISFDPDHPRIAAERERYLKKPGYLKMVTQRAEPFLHFILEALEHEDLPIELALLPIVESAYIVDAVSRNGAAGIWQFIPATGKTYGLGRGEIYEGRQDIIASTVAAMSYLKKLSGMFEGDWLNALAGYNVGEMNVLRAVEANRRAGKPSDFWNLDLREETAKYVPRFLAVLSIVMMPEYYGIELWPVADEPYLTTVEIEEGGVSVSRVAEAIGADPALMRRLNAGLTRDVTPPNERYQLVLPIRLAQKLDVRALASLKAAPTPVAEPTVKTVQAASTQTTKVKSRVHTVKPGETLAKLSRIYGVPIASIKTLNRLTSDQIKPDQTLNIPST